MTEEEIHTICKKYNIKNYQINPDMTIDVGGNVDLHNKNLITLPLKFRKVDGFFYCSENKSMSSLDGCPSYIGSHFICSLTSLPTLNDLPMNFHIGVRFYWYENNTTDVNQFSRLFFGHIGGKIETGYDNLNDFLNNNKNPPKKDLPRLLSELRKIKL